MKYSRRRFREILLNKQSLVNFYKPGVFEVMIWVGGKRDREQKGCVS